MWDSGFEVAEQKSAERDSEQGFMLLGLMVAIFLILLALGAAAPVIARSLRRDRELEAVQRGNQYVRAIQLYYRKFGHYPGSIEQLENSNNIRFLRQRYKDPINGKEDWRPIAVGQNKTTVKGFFGEPLAGLTATGLNAGTANLSSGIGGASMSGVTNGPNGGGAAAGGLSLGTSSSAGGLSPGSSGPGGGSSPATSAAAAAGGAAGATGTTGATDPSAGASAGGIGQATPGLGLGAGSGTGQPFMGMGLSASGSSILELNEQTTYNTWEFLYDPRIDQMKAGAAALNGGGLSSGGLGTTTLGGAATTTGAAGVTSSPTSPDPTSLGTPPTKQPQQ